jgi:hypothetical protein
MSAGETVRMRPEQWESASLREMLPATPGQVSDRKLDLFNGWCCHALWPYLTDPRSRAAARYAEQHVEQGCPDSPEREAILLAAKAAVEELIKKAHHAPTAAECRRRFVYAWAAQIAQQALGHDQPNRGVYANALLTAQAFGYANDERAACLPGSEELRDERLKTQAAIFRDIVGNPFDPVALDPRWRTEDTLGLARGIYEDRAFVRLPLLGDALMDAGCDDERLLSHCRTRGSHARGCWAVDLILGKS